MGAARSRRGHASRLHRSARRRRRSPPHDRDRRQRARSPNLRARRHRRGVRAEQSARPRCVRWWRRRDRALQLRGARQRLGAEPRPLLSRRDGPRVHAREHRPVSLGFDLTLERSPGRRYLLPYVGVQMGIAYQQQSGSFGWAMPLIGIYPWASHAVRVSLQGGYLLPTTASQDLRGIVVQASVDLAPF